MSATKSPNRTSSASVYDLPFSIWITYETISAILIAIALYIFVALVHFSARKVCFSACGKRRKASINNSKNENLSSSAGAGGKGGSTSSAEGGRRKRSDGTGKAARPLRILCLSASFFALLRVCSDQLELATYGGERIDCKLIQVMVVVTYSVSATLNYSALWVRLRIFFAHPVMKHLASTGVQFLIWFALFAIIGSSLLNTLIFTITVQAVEKAHGCSLGNTTSISPTVRYVILTISSVGAQVLLLSLFLYPLIKHRSKVKSTLRQASVSSSVRSNNNNNPNNKTMPGHEKAANPSVSSFQQQHPDFRRVRSSERTESESEAGNKKSWKKGISFRKTKQANREKRLLRIIRRVMITALVCVASDIITAIATLAFNDSPRVASNLFFNANLLINIFSVLLSFGDWQKRLIPCCAKLFGKKKRSGRHASATSAGSRMPLGRQERRMHPDVGKNYGGDVLPNQWAHNPDSTESQVAATPSQIIDDEVFTYSKSAD